MALKIKVYGIVQGVGFRNYTRHWAKKLNIRGYVRNCKDGSVEIHAEGEGKKLKDFLNFVERGPPLAKVSKVEIKEVEDEFYESFTVIK